MFRSSILRFSRAAQTVGTFGCEERVSMQMFLEAHSADIARPLDESETASRRGERLFPETFVNLRRSDNTATTVDFVGVIAAANRAREKSEEPFSKCAVSNIKFDGGDVPLSGKTSSALASLSGRKTVVLESQNFDSEVELTDCLSSVSLLLGSRDRILVCDETTPSDDSQRHKIANKARLIAARHWGGISGPSVQEYIPDVVSEASAMTDFLFMDVIGVSRLEERPIELRNPNIFYWGHLPAFSDIMALQLPDETRTADQHDKASFYRENFERGHRPRRGRSYPNQSKSLLGASRVVASAKQNKNVR